MGSDAPLLDIAEETLVKFETEVMPVPQFDPENPTMISQGPSVCIFNKPDGQEVLASWLFTQFLLTNDVQISYAQTEGYVPVTAKAQESEEYKDYLAREGEDGELHYDVKLKATKLLLENTENTFVTPVFNGSASLRDAAGHLIESVTKSIRRKEKVNDAYYKKLFADTRTLYRLEGLTGGAGEASLGPLPKEAWILMGSVDAVWICLGLSTLKRKK
jgi:multiple sugar transport system substrate-binding protein